MEKPLVVCWHGFLGRAQDWMRLPWPDSVELLSLDLWSEFERLEPRSLEDWAAKQELPQKKIWGVGYSMGGRLLMQTFLAQPERFHGLVIVAAHPGLDNPEQKEQRIQSDYKWQQKFLVTLWEDLLNDWNSQPVLATSPSWLLKEEEFRRETLAQVMEVVSLGRQQNLLLKMCSKKPVLWLAGKRDTKFAELYQRLALENLEVEIWPGSGHRLPWDEPAQFAQRVCEFVLENSSESDQ